MIAAVLTEPNKPLDLAEIAWGPLKYGQVAVRVLATGICGAQLQEIRGEKGNHFPRLIGHEAAVEVCRFGGGVKRVKVGDRCIAHWRKGDGIESESPTFLYKAKEYTAGQITTFSKYSVISENRLTPVPDDTPVELCSLLGCALSTALGTIENEANLKFGEDVLIIGCGGLGLNLVLASKIRGANHIVAMDISDKHEVAFSVGASSFWNIEKEMSPPAKRLQVALCEDWPYDVVIDTTGDPSAIELGLSKLRPSGRFIMVGQPKPNSGVIIPNARSMFDGVGKSISATQGGRINPSTDLLRYTNLYRRDDLRGYFSKLITHRFKLIEINEALETVRQGHAGRVLIEP